MTEPDRHGIAAAGATVVTGLIAELKCLPSERRILIAQVAIDKVAAKAKSSAVELEGMRVELVLHLLGGDAHHVLRVIKVHMGEADVLELVEDAVDVLLTGSVVGINASCEFHR